MYFDDDFFMAEEKNGFHIRSIMKRMWAVEMDILQVLADIFSRYDIKWYTDSGTLLGSVRHKGFIPWDDDIDIAIPREDFERFLKIAPDNLPEGWRVFNGRTDPAPSGIITRVINTDEVCTEPAFLNKYHGCPYIMGVDLFVLDAVPDDPAEDEIFRALLTMTYDIFGQTDNKMLLKDCPQNVREEADQLIEALDVTIDPDLPIKRQMLFIGDQIASLYNGTGAEYVTIEPFYINRPEVRIPAKCYDKTIYLPFESMTLPAPEDYDTVLKIWYGDDYMTPKQYNPHPALNESERLLRLYYAQRGLEFPREFE